MSITISNPTGRNTNAHVVKIGEHELFFSYNSLIAYRDSHQAVRIKNFWGPTTGRHFNELGCKNFEMLPCGEDELSSYAQRALLAS